MHDSMFAAIINPPCRTAALSLRSVAGGSRWLGRSGVNRNQFYSVRIGQAMNTGVQIDAGDTNQVSSLLSLPPSPFFGRLLSLVPQHPGC